MLGFMGVTAFLSMWISNTATTAMMVPIVQAVLDQLHHNGDPASSTKRHQEETLRVLEAPGATGKNGPTKEPHVCFTGPSLLFLPP